MMMHAYDEIFLDDAMENLGNAMEYAVYGLGMTGQEFLDSFALSVAGRCFSRGDVRYLSGMSGIELARTVVYQEAIQIDMGNYELRVDYSPEYWTGWALAYYQWYTARSFEQIASHISFLNLENLYDTLHEADVSKVVDVFDIFFEEQGETKLAQLRMSAGLSQSELARNAQVSLRSIQMYEQRNNDIRKAQMNRLLALARALNCRVEDIVEY